jgi:hypothetical protein
MEEGAGNPLALRSSGTHCLSLARGCAWKSPGLATRISRRHALSPPLASATHDQTIFHPYTRFPQIRVTGFFISNLTALANEKRPFRSFVFMNPTALGVFASGGHNVDTKFGGFRQGGRHHRTAS